MKRTDQIVKAFNIAKTKLPNLKLIIAGANIGKFGQIVKDLIAQSPYSKDIQLLGKVTEEKKINLLQRSHILVVTSQKEGWCLTVTEANSQGTPAVVYNVDGLKDSVRDNMTGVICKQNTPEELAKKIVSVIKDKKTYQEIQKKLGHGVKRSISKRVIWIL